MRIVAARDRCIGAGQCVLAAPEYFDQSDEDGVVVVLDAFPEPEAEALVNEAIHACPANALSGADSDD